MFGFRVLGVWGRGFCFQVLISPGSLKRNCSEVAQEDAKPSLMYKGVIKNVGFWGLGSKLLGGVIFGDYIGEYSRVY